MPTKNFENKSVLSRWLILCFSGLILMMVILAFLVLNAADKTHKNNLRSSFENTLGTALQLQLRYYRMINTILQIEEDAPHLNGQLYIEYKQVMSYVDMLREGEASQIIRFFEQGRPIRLLYLIHGELKLLERDVSQIDAGDRSNLPTLLNKLDRLEREVNEFLILVQQGSNTYETAKRHALEKNIQAISFLMWTLFFGLMLSAIFLTRFLFYSKSRFANKADVSDRIESISKSKLRFLSVLNHEIRASINGILGMTNTLSKTALNSRQIKMLQTVQDAGNTLLHNLSVFSDLSEMEGNSLELTFTFGNLQNEMEQVCQRINQSGRRNDAHLFSFIDLDLPQQCCSDFGRLRQIFLALLDNAFTYSPDNNITLVVRQTPLDVDTWRPSDDDSLAAMMIQIAVRGTGLNLTDDQKRTIMTGFDYLETEDERKYIAGLNLSMCYRLAKIMKGKLQFSSSHGSGNEFWIDIPIYYKEKTPLLKEQATLDKAIPSIKDKKVLIIEDNEHCAHILRMQVDSLGLTTVLNVERLTEGLDLHIDIVIITNDEFLDSTSYDLLSNLAYQGCQILCANSLTRKQTVNLPSLTQFSFPLSQATLQKHLMSIFPRSRNQLL